MIKALHLRHQSITIRTKNTLLILAGLSMIKSDIDGLKQCINQNVNILAVDYQGNTGLHMAAGNGHTEVIKLIVSSEHFLTMSQEQKTSLINARNSSLNTPLHWAVLNKQVDAISMLLELGGDTSVENSEGSTPLFLAILSDQEELVDILAPHTALKEETSNHLELVEEEEK